MPRPPQQVPPDTLGGRIRAARKKQRKSLAQVAGDRYSTSLLSQIERNKIEPSTESLHFLAVQLRLSFEELKALAQRQKESEPSEARYKHFDTIRAKAAQAIALHRNAQALEMLEGINLPLVPPALRWRLASLRGQCHFALRKFIAAEKDFLYADTELPFPVPEELRPEVMLLHLRHAATLRELEQPAQALPQFESALAFMSRSTPVYHVAEAHWGMSLIYSELANRTECQENKQDQLTKALRHAEDARVLCRSIGERQRAALLTCQVALVEQALDRRDDARRHLQELLAEEEQFLAQLNQNSPADSRLIKESANVYSAAACSLAGIEIEDGNREEALNYVQKAREKGQMSYTLRLAEAEMMLGYILERGNMADPQAEEAFRLAVQTLEKRAPERVAARIRAHDMLGRHLLKNGKMTEGDRELDAARQLSRTATVFSTTIPVETEQNDNNHAG